MGRSRGRAGASFCWGWNSSLPSGFAGWSEQWRNCAHSRVAPDRADPAAKNVLHLLAEYCLIDVPLLVAADRNDEDVEGLGERRLGHTVRVLS